MITDFVTPEQVKDLMAAIESCRRKGRHNPDSQRAHAMRNLLSEVPAVRAVAESDAMIALVSQHLGERARVVRGLLFDKTPGSNWKVSFHQDLSIAVRARAEVAGFGPWSMKAGVQHVQPPVEILQQMLTVRLHLDDCDVDNGPLRVIPGTHRDGVLSPAAVEQIRNSRVVVDCTVAAGGAVLMRPLLLHGSSPAVAPSHRRVVHLEFAGCDLPRGLDWFEAPARIERAARMRPAGVAIE